MPHSAVPGLRVSHQPPAVANAPPHAPAVFVVTEADAAAIHASGEFAAAVELRRPFPSSPAGSRGTLRAVKRLPNPTRRKG